MKKILATLMAALAICSCAPTTPQERIDKNPGTFAALGKKEQDLVRQGQLAAGMSREAVSLAWGSPDQRFEGSKNGKHSERWDYAGSRPVYSSNYFGGFGYGYGGYGYGRYGYSGLGWNLGPQVEYIPYRIASVWFINHRVESWERLR